MLEILTPAIVGWCLLLVLMALLGLLNRACEWQLFSNGEELPKGPSGPEYHI